MAVPLSHSGLGGTLVSNEHLAIPSALRFRRRFDGVQFDGLRPEQVGGRLAEVVEALGDDDGLPSTFEAE